jgi:hypothetical protein
VRLEYFRSAPGTTIRGSAPASSGSVAPATKLQVALLDQLLRDFARPPLHPARTLTG